MGECNCGAATEGKWADIHTRGCPAATVGPMERARTIVEDHVAAYGPVPHPEELKDAIAADLGFVQLAATPYRHG